jgi:hypothetical protein
MTAKIEIVPTIKAILERFKEGTYTKNSENSLPEVPGPLITEALSKVVDQKLDDFTSTVVDQKLDDFTSTVVDRELDDFTSTEDKTKKTVVFSSKKHGIEITFSEGATSESRLIGISRNNLSNSAEDLTLVILRTPTSTKDMYDIEIEATGPMFKVENSELKATSKTIIKMEDVTVEEAWE